MVEKCRLEMLIRWEKLEKPTWTKLFSALVNIGMKGLADSLAEKYGLPQPFRVAATPAKGSTSSKLMESEQKLLMKTKQLKQAKQLQNVTSQKLEKEVAQEVPLLQHKVKSLTSETEFLRMQLKRRNEEMEMFENMKLSAKQDELQLLDNLLKEKNEQIRSLEDELTQKEMELDTTKKQLKDKETELAGMMEELSAKSTQVIELETEVDRLRQSFNEQQEEMNTKLIETSAAYVSHEKYLKEVEIQRDIAVKEASKKKEEIQSYSRELTDKEEQISRLSEKIAEQEREMAKLREELDSHHRTSEQLSAEQMREDDEREQQLLTIMMSAMKLQLELRKTKDKKNQDKMNLEGAKKTVEKYETMLEVSNQRADAECQSSTDDSVPLVKSLQEKKNLEEGTSPLVSHVEEGTSPLDPSNIRLTHWRAAKSAPCTMERYVDAAVDGDTVYFIPYYDTRRVLAYNSTNDTWCELPDTPTFDSSIAIVNNKLTSIGGRKFGVDCNRLFSLIEESDGRKWVETLPPMPVEDMQTRTVCSETHLIVAGIDSTTIQTLDTTSLIWSLVAKQPIWSDLDSLVVCGEYLYLVYMDQRVFRCSTSVLIKSTQSSVIWSKIHLECGIHSILSYSTYVAIHGCLVSVGGEAEWEPTTAIRMYSPTTKTWKMIGHMKTARKSCLAAVLPNNRLLVVGGYIARSWTYNETNEVEIATIF